MNSTNTPRKVRSDELYYKLSRLNEVAKAVANAKSSADAEYFTIRYLRPQIDETESLLADMRQIFKH